MKQPTRPASRYQGAKWMLGPWILQFFGPHRSYVEPFAGSGSVLMRKPRAYSEVLNDLDDHVVNFFRVLQDPAGAAELASPLYDRRLGHWARFERRHMADGGRERLEVVWVNAAAARAIPQQELFEGAQ
jgi:hypothetical protein